MNKNRTMTRCPATRLDLTMTKLISFSQGWWFDSRSRGKAARRALVCRGYASPTRADARENLRLPLRGTPVVWEMCDPEHVRELKTATASVVTAAAVYESAALVDR